MDRVVKKKKITIKRVFIALFILVTISILIAASRKGFEPSFKVRKSEIITSEVKKMSLAETIQVIGSVEPKKHIYLESRERGYIKKIVDSGLSVNPGDIVIEIANRELELELESYNELLVAHINEFKLFQEESQLKSIEYREELLNLNYELDSLKSVYDINSELYSSGGVSKESLRKSESDYNYYLEKKGILEDKIQRLKSIDDLKRDNYRLKEESLNRDILICKGRIDNLSIKATKGGIFNYDGLYIGQSLEAGTLLGAISSDSDYIIRSEVDEFYLKELSIGDRAEFKGKSDSSLGEAVLKKISKEIENSRVSVDFEIESATDLTSGQTLTVKIFTGKSKDRLVIENGAFYKESLGNWIYRVEGDSALKKDIKTGFKNVDFIEITQGLNIGDRVIVSNYERFKEFEKLKIEEQK